MSIKSSKLREKNNGDRERESQRWERRGRGRRLMEKCPKSDLSKVNKEFKGWD